jgi:hypothetical protein
MAVTPTGLSMADIRTQGVFQLTVLPKYDLYVYTYVYVRHILLL